ncbi:Dyp-type peroxidase [Oceanospirillum beijerinckii]|uniref:Dyp-type peroxidase n=1 Tax=Oceanospirillum beijerinckii TaxID=64976 RepID=UPI00040BA71A|nr:Dyp-type peroxidase [Oceanospirillum beijerinckii]
MQDQSGEEGAQPKIELDVSELQSEQIGQQGIQDVAGTLMNVGTGDSDLSGSALSRSTLNEQGLDEVDVSEGGLSGSASGATEPLQVETDPAAATDSVVALSPGANSTGENEQETEDSAESAQEMAQAEEPEIPLEPAVGTYQDGILAESTAHGYYITYTLNSEDDYLPLIKDVLGRFPAMIDECKRVFDVPSLSGVVAIGAEAWNRLYPEAKPIALKPFPAMKQDTRSAPETPCDLFFQIRCERQDINFVVARRVDALLGELAILQESIPTFRYLDNRDLTGFVDGTENPEGEHREKVAIVGQEDRNFVGGSYVHIQRYVHNLAVWNNLEVTEQEQVIGRSKTDNVEFTGVNKPMCSHIKRSGIKDEGGDAVEILRQSMPYGDLKEQGLYFVSYCRFADNFTRMLASMIYSDAEGSFDHLMKYTQAVTGAALFAPSREFLTQYVGAAAEAERLRAQRIEEEAARLAAEEEERNSTRSELKYTPLSDEMIEVNPEIDEPKPDTPVDTTPEQVRMDDQPPATSSNKRYSASFYQAMIEDDEQEKQASEEQVKESLKSLKGLPWSLNDAAKKNRDQDDD